ncbi:MAG: transcription antitermination factor NusB [Geminicoccaceae bacterium]|nr:transcription antitermination factor NusB [Geminicoccaceae bacterium]MCS7266591.1 transcription antitermination factor NusB [Geminicoccaceae bacterium]MCX7630686.1 transcription antitermination factor NusB [Geminicoccaceae bacterium]MDW8123224.1 transcription antitermination factor NusB [Geminicoccaceae bacterium]MDW8340116.1 transcription antitermination factor NusB [Geminicoccaceae bacterium]
MNGGGRAPAAMRRRHEARLAAVQGLYQLDLAGGDPAEVAREIVEHRPPDAPPLEEAWLRKVLVGAWTARARLDPEIAAVLAEGWTLPRLGAVTRAILRAGAYELAELVEVPVRVVINEYVEITHLFAAGGEPAFVHAVLDRLAGKFRRSGEDA